MLGQCWGNLGAPRPSRIPEPRLRRGLMAKLSMAARALGPKVLCRTPPPPSPVRRCPVLTLRPRPPHLPPPKPAPVPHCHVSLLPIPPRSPTWQESASQQQQKKTQRAKGGQARRTGLFSLVPRPLVRLSWEIGGQGAPHWPNSAAHPPASYVFHVLSGFDGDGPMVMGWGSRSILALLLHCCAFLLIIDVFFCFFLALRSGLAAWCCES